VNKCRFVDNRNEAVKFKDIRHTILC
jgi:hypothetical protein